MGIKPLFFNISKVERLNELGLHLDEIKYIYDDIIPPTSAVIRNTKKVLGQMPEELIDLLDENDIYPSDDSNIIISITDETRDIIITVEESEVYYTYIDEFGKSSSGRGNLNKLLEEKFLKVRTS